MPYSLKRKRDSAGDSGQMSTSLKKNDLGEIIKIENSRPTVGYSIMVGSYYARTFSKQDWWCTTPVTEIIHESENIVIFKTGNSEYRWEQF